ncbi:hypothetical protein Ancab_040407 [Ancistrocladus abbreviatus]
MCLCPVVANSGKYYFVDSDYPNTIDYIASYKETRYHLSDFHRGRVAQGKEEKFNFTHSSLRNVIERCFSVLKARFPILKQMPNYSLQKQMFIVVAVMTCHNFIRMKLRSDELFELYGNEDASSALNDAMHRGIEAFDFSLDDWIVLEMEIVR